MAKQKLKSQTPLHGAQKTISGIRISECTELTIYALHLIAPPKTKFAKAIKDICGANPPDAGISTTNAAGDIRLVWMARDLIFMLCDGGNTPDMDHIGDALRDLAYVSDQSDTWVALRVCGANLTAMLERSVAIDLAPDQFGPNAATRCAMEGLHTLIVNEGAQSYLLCSASSSARSFLHSVEVSAQNIAD